jgi:hypothetical protein
MSYSTPDTDWRVSAKGNSWRRFNGVVLIVGRKQTSGAYWARRGDNFLPGNFPSLKAAKLAAESGGAGVGECLNLLDEES